MNKANKLTSLISWWNSVILCLCVFRFTFESHHWNRTNFVVFNLMNESKTVSKFEDNTSSKINVSVNELAASESEDLSRCNAIGRAQSSIALLTAVSVHWQETSFYCKSNKWATFYRILNTIHNSFGVWLSRKILRWFVFNHLLVGEHRRTYSFRFMMPKSLKII